MNCVGSSSNERCRHSIDLMDHFFTVDGQPYFVCRVCWINYQTMVGEFKKQDLLREISYDEAVVLSIMER